MPEGAAEINVAGKRLAGPVQGFGKMWQKTYQVSLPAERVPATELIATWKQRFPDFWPEGNRFYAPLTGIEPGEVALISMTLPGRLKLSTGVMVLYADDESFTLMTPQGHMFAGWITFSATERDGADRGAGAGAHARLRPGLRARTDARRAPPGGQVLEPHAEQPGRAPRLARRRVETAVVCVDKRRQWSRWTNVWQSSAIRSTVWMMGAPFRAVRGGARRKRAVG